MSWSRSKLLKISNALNLSSHVTRSHLDQELLIKKSLPSTPTVTSSLLQVKLLSPFHSPLLNPILISEPPLIPSLYQLFFSFRLFLLSTIKILIKSLWLPIKIRFRLLDYSKILLKSKEFKKFVILRMPFHSNIIMELISQFSSVRMLVNIDYKVQNLKHLVSW